MKTLQLLREKQPNCGTIFTIATAFLLSFLFFCGNGSFFLLFVLFVNLVMREQALIPGFASRFCLKDLTLGRMPILTKRSRASTFQEECAWLSKNHTRVTFASDTPFFLNTPLSRVIDGSEGVAAFGVGFCARSSLSCRKLHLSPFEHWPFSFHW